MSAAQDPAVRTWQSAVESQLSTSATARQLQAELDRARKDFNDVLFELADVRAAAERNVERLAFARRQFSDALRQRDEARALADKREGEWFDLKAENERLKERPWIVARDGGRPCERCEGEVRRGEAYEYLGVDQLRHVHCPNGNESS